MSKVLANIVLLPVLAVAIVVCRIVKGSDWTMQKFFGLPPEAREEEK